MAHRHFPRQRNMQSKSRYKFSKNPENCKWLKTSKNSISLEVFFSDKKTANETFQGCPELHFECKFQIYASKKYLVTK